MLDDDIPHDFLSMTQAAKAAPGRPHRATVIRWWRDGISTHDGQRVRLRCAKFGGRLFTTRKWLNDLVPIRITHNLPIVPVAMLP